MGDTIAVTLLRAVSEMGDWGVFPTELSQMQKSVTLSYSVMPFEEEKEAIPHLSAFQYPVFTKQIVEHESEMKEEKLLSWSGEGLKASAFKKKMNQEDIILRWTNYTNQEQVLRVEKTAFIDNLYRSNVIEEKGECISPENGAWRITVKPFEIITLGVEK